MAATGVCGQNRLSKNGQPGQFSAMLVPLQSLGGNPALSNIPEFAQLRCYPASASYICLPDERLHHKVRKLKVVASTCTCQPQQVLQRVSLQRPLPCNY